MASKISDLIRSTIASQINRYPHLEEWWQGYDPLIHETQVNVNQQRCNERYPSIRRGKSIRWVVPHVEREKIGDYHLLEELDEYHIYDDDSVTFIWDGPTFEVGNIRIPYGTNTDEPTFHDGAVNNPVHFYWDRIGTSGWNWRDKKSEFVGFDFDAICKSKNGNGLTDDQLAEISDRVRDIPWVIVRTSTGGKGLHLLVPAANPPTTRNHDAHAEFAEHVLEKLSEACDFPFEDSMDVCGRILWHYSKEMNGNCLKRID